MNTTHTVTIKVVPFSVIDGVLAVYMPGGTLPSHVLSPLHAFDDEVVSIIGSSGLPLAGGFIEQLYSVKQKADSSDVSVLYYMLLESETIPVSLRKAWVGVGVAHISSIDQSLIEYAIQRLRWKIEYTNIVYSLLPIEFTLSQLQRIYEAILGKQLDKRNFRKKILSLGILKDIKKKKILGRARPASIYTFKDRHMTFVEVL